MRSTLGTVGRKSKERCMLVSSESLPRPEWRATNPLSLRSFVANQRPQFPQVCRLQTNQPILKTALILVASGANTMRAAHTPPRAKSDAQCNPPGCFLLERGPNRLSLLDPHLLRADDLFESCYSGKRRKTRGARIRW